MMACKPSTVSVAVTGTDTIADHRLMDDGSVYGPSAALINPILAFDACLPVQRSFMEPGVAYRP
jgi:hypothetical protein